MKWSEILLLAILALFSGMLLKDSFALSYSSETGFGPGFIPRNFAIVTILLVGLLGFQLLKAVRLLEEATDGVEDKDAVYILAPVSAVALLFLATYAMHFGSVLAPLAVVITIISAVFLKHSWPKSALLSIVTLSVIYAIFSLWLKIPVV